MASVLDVAAFILENRGPLTGRKLQKLVYYCQAWSLGWTGHALFKEPIEAWRDGPVIPTLYRVHRGSALAASVPGGNSKRLTASEKDTIDSVLAFYGDKSEEWLIQQSHDDDPWKSARSGVLPWQASKQIISQESMRRFYGALAAMKG